MRDDSGVEDDTGALAGETHGSTARADNGSPAGQGPADATPRPLLEFLGPPPLGRWEDREAFDQLHGAISGNVKPADAIEAILVREAALKYWEVLRTQRAVTARLDLAFVGSLAYAIRHTAADGARQDAANLSQERARAVLVGGEAPAAAMAKSFASLGFDEDQLDDLRVLPALPDLERLQRLTDQAMAAFERFLRQVEQRRASLGARVRSAVAACEDAEFHDQ